MKLLSATLAAIVGVAGPSVGFAQSYQQSSLSQSSARAQAPLAAGRYAGPYRPYDAPAHAAAPAGALASYNGSLAPYHGAADGGCQDASCGPCAAACEDTCYVHRTGAFAEYLHWQVRGIDMPYAAPQDGIGGVGTVPVGDIGTADFDYDNGFRFGFNLALDCKSSVGAAFTWFETNTDDFLSVAAPNVVQPLVMFPGTFNAGFTAQAALAGYSLDLQMADIDYRAVWLEGSNYYVNYLAGVRYGHIDQNFMAVFPFAPPDGTHQVDTEINFDGGGIRLGLEGERRLWKRSGLRLYGKASASLLAGEFRSSYLQTNQFGGVEAAINWDDTRVVPIGEYELGVSWTSSGDFVRLSAGYHFAWWGNVVTTPDFVNAVQGYDFTDVGQDDQDNITFDGLVARLELRL